MKVIALKRHYYNGKTREEGEEFDVIKQSDFDILSRIGQIRSSEVQGEVIPAKSTRGRYKRRDLTAQQ